MITLESIKNGIELQREEALAKVVKAKPGTREYTYALGVRDAITDCLNYVISEINESEVKDD
ncbi:hypothetical protein [Pediococcus acidilactici]|uniref:hypothetical protein n=1 Tax=Pediococcus acidilactici TaxID=1254 RepID=UPI001321637C|nr:hypothetical protein [Pediococcus acidilactici]KAF0372777.1 hypothetical protein GBO58_03635 [Pediococcus acidilactici]KAF0383352.1 hypothetical protein GBO62_04410 [Pediococcus acidilactici]KAF0457398.1 hypothetical protein GBP02_04410 [Pediococcus acidilactici]KAF0476468.1 hypothetical protein GBP10_03845 [Pediococcus acidilactici]KAF0536989.1 hypothetical protein GBP37_03855 [Pediococcus acidilactici]